MPRVSEKWPRGAANFRIFGLILERNAWFWKTPSKNTCFSREKASQNLEKAPSVKNQKNWAPMASKGSTESVHGSSKKIPGELQWRPRQPKTGPGGAQDVSRGLQKVPKGAQGSLKGYPGYAKTIREVQVLYSRLYIERIVCQVWIPSFLFQVLCSKFYIIGFIFQGFIFQCLYSRLDIPSFIF